MGVITCKHKEKIEDAGDGFERGVCSICHQVRMYNTKNLKENPMITKLGRINGDVVLPGKGNTLSLAPQEAEELTSAMALTPSAEKPGAAEGQQNEDKAASDVPVDINELTPSEKFEMGRYAAEKGLKKAGLKYGVSWNILRGYAMSYRKEVVKTEANDNPPPKRGKSLDQYFEKNKEAILQDYQNLKLAEFYAKWQMGPASWTKLKREWKVLGKMPRKSTLRTEKQREQIAPPSIKEINSALKKQGANYLPAFPIFNEQWSDFVKISWFGTYRALKEFEVKQ